MTRLDDPTQIDEPPEHVWRALGLLDALVVRRKWDAGVRSFFVCSKDFVESGARRSVTGGT